MVFETLGSVQGMHIDEKAGDGLIRLTGVFGQCGVKNQNNRVYNKQNYGKMVEALQQQILTEGLPGEYEHPNSMNIDLNRVSHKIESIQMDENGLITGTIVLLNTRCGKDAQAIVEGGLPLYISSRGAGSIDESGNVTLSTIKTYDLVGTPGFKNAKLNLAAGKKFECLNESLEDGNYMYAIIDEGEDEKKEEKSEDDKKDEKSDDKKSDDKKSDDKKEDKPADDKKDDSKSDDKKEDKKTDKKDENNDIDEMEDIKNSIDKLTDRITSLEASLHVAQESLEAKDKEIAELKESLDNIQPTNYEAIQNWIEEEYAPELKGSILAEAFEEAKNWIVESFAPTVNDWVVEEFAPQVQNWITEEFAPVVEGWVTEEFAPVVEKWVTEEFAGQIDNWVNEEVMPTQSENMKRFVNEEFAANVQNWLTEEFAPQIDAWVNEEVIPEASNSIMESVNKNVSAFMESKKSDKLDSIDKMLEVLENSKPEANVQAVLESVNANNKYAGVYVVENMPAEYKPMWEMMNEARKDEVLRSSKMYDFTKRGVLESFWATVKFDQTKPVFENKAPEQPTYHNNIIAAMKALRHA